MAGYVLDLKQPSDRIGIRIVRRRNTLMNNKKIFLVASISIGMTVGMAASPAFAISVDLAKKCRDMAIKAHPFDVAGSKTGSAAAERSYFKECVAKGGNMPDTQQDSGATGKSEAAPANGSK